MAMLECTENCDFFINTNQFGTVFNKYSFLLYRNSSTKIEQQFMIRITKTVRRFPGLLRITVNESTARLQKLLV